jgi:uncharacterized repeat protein (TIGR02543 family)
MLILVGCKLDITTITTNPPITSTSAQTTASPSTTTGALTTPVNTGTTTLPVTTTVAVTTTVPITTTTVTTTVPTTTNTTAEGGYNGDSFDNPIVLSLDTVQTANIDVGDKYIYYRFIPAVTGTYTIESSGAFDSYVQLFDVDQEEISHNDENGAESNFLLTESLTGGQTYYYVVSLYYSTDIGSFTFILVEGAGVAGDSFANPITITVGEEYTANIDVADKYIFYQFIPAVTGSYTIESSGINDPYVELFDAEEDYVTYDHESGVNHNFLLTETLTAGQTYYYVVSLYSTTLTGSFTFVLTSAAGYAGDSFANPITITVNENLTANIDVEGKYYYYRFIPAVTGYFTIESAGEFDTYVELYDASETEILHDDEGGTESNFLLTESLIAGQTYFIVVSMYYETDVGSFTFNIVGSAVFSFETNGGTVIEDFAGVVLYEAPRTTKTGYYFAGWYDNSGCTGNSLTYPFSSNTDITLYALWWTSPVYDGKCYATAYELTESLNYTVNISTPGQVAHYIFTPTVTGSYTVQSTGDADTYCWLEDAGLTTVLDSDDESGEGSNFLITFTMEAGTSYYISPCLYYEDVVGSFVISIAPTVIN